ncbi:MAG: hypothetical protein ABIJ09_13860 [Pseudomonadota bacterium]
MNSLRAVVRVSPDGSTQVVHVQADPLLAPMAAHLVQRAQQQARAELMTAGVYRLEISGDAHAPRIGVAHLAGSRDSLIVAELAPGEDGAAVIRDLVFSKGEDAQVSAAQFLQLLGESLSREASALDGRGSATLEIVVAAAPI